MWVVLVLRQKRRDGQQTTFCSKIKDGRVEKGGRTKRFRIKMHQHEEVIEASSNSSSSNEPTLKKKKKKLQTSTFHLFYVFVCHIY